MTIGIYAPNIRAGGGLTHLTELLRHASTATSNRIVVAACEPVLRRIPTTAQFDPVLLPETNGLRGLGSMFYPTVAERALASCAAVFVPGGICRIRHERLVSMSQNLLPFVKRERRRYGSLAQIRYLLVRELQLSTFRRSAGLLFLTETARNTVSAMIGPQRPGIEVRVIPHGVDERFRERPRIASRPEHYSTSKPFRILYVSVVAPYKHQSAVVEAVGQLRRSGLPIALDLVGPGEDRALELLRATLGRVDPSGAFVRYHGEIPYESLHPLYASADAFVFASTCENLPNILIEAMASGLPIATSKTQPMPEIVGDAALLFDAESVSDIADTIGRLFSDPQQREVLAQRAHQRVQSHTWDRCARETLALIETVARS